MAITEEIDLTINSEFAGDEDETLLPWPIRQMRRNEFFTERRLILGIDGLVLHFDSSELPFFKENEDPVQADIDAYIMFFGMCKEAFMRWEKLDPYAYYMFGAGMTCDRCGCDLSFFNRGASRTLCQECEVYDEEDFRIN